MRDFNLNDALRKTPQYQSALAEAMNELEHKATPKPPRRSWRGPSGTVAPVLRHCRFIQHCHDNASTLSEPEWYATVSMLARLSDGKEAIHTLSQSYPDYSPGVTEQKIEYALHAHGPHTCAYIQQRLGFSGCPPGGCGVKSPAGLAVSTRARQLLEARERYAKAVIQAQEQRAAAIARARHIRAQLNS